MWKVECVNDDILKFLRSLDTEVIDEIVDEFITVQNVFDKMRRSICCSSVIFEVKKYKIKNKKLELHYHIDNDDKIFRITNYIIE